jgi:hypothetical protein
MVPRTTPHVPQTFPPCYSTFSYGTLPPQYFREIMPALSAVNKLFSILDKKGLTHLLKGWRADANSARAASRIEKGESPYFVLSEENNIPMDPRSRAIRSLKSGRGSESDEVYHATASQEPIDFDAGSHFGTREAAHQRLGGVLHDNTMLAHEPESLGAIYPTRLRNKRYADRTEDLEGPYIDELKLPLQDFIDEAKRQGNSPTDTLKYENFMEGSGADSYMNINEDVRGKFAAFNPHWDDFKDFLAAGLPLSFFFGGEE